MYEPPPRTGQLMGRRTALRLLGVAAFGLLTGCWAGKQRSTPTSAGPGTAPPTGSAQPAPTATPLTTTSASAAPQTTVAQTTARPLSADQLLAASVAAAEVALLAAYDAAADAHPELAGRLAPFRADHAAHLHGLAPGATPSAAPSSTTPFSSVPSSTPPAIAPLSSPPASTEILQQLAGLERAAAAARVNDVVTTSGPLARLIASIGGCEAAHAALLSVAT